MNLRITIYVLVIAASVLLPSRRICAQNAELGLLSSLKSAGVSFMMMNKNGNMSLARIYVDLDKVLRGVEQTPGVKADYHILLSLTEKKWGDALGLNLLAGPGAAVGYAIDKGKSHGMIAGLSGVFMARFSFKPPVTISVGLSCIMGCHITTKSKFEKTLTLYKSGIYNAYIPEITINWQF